MEAQTRTPVRLVLFTLLLLVFAVPAWAQIQTGSILVKLTDEQGGALPGATVTVTGATLPAPIVGVSDGAGAYRAPALAPGTYHVRVELSSFQPMEHPEVVVNVGQTSSFDVVMKVAAVKEAFTVTAAIPTIDTTSANASTTINLGILQNTPGGRDIWSLLQSKGSGLTTSRIDVGGSESGLQSGFVVRGTQHSQNTQALNGVNVTDPVTTGFSQFYYDYDTFQEVQVSTGAHPIEVGPPGVYVNMVTKTGTNVLKGLVSFNFQNDSLQSDNVDEELEAQGVTKVGFDYLSDFTAQAGGPIVKDKLHVFGAYRDWRVHRFVTGFVDDQGVPLVEPTDMYSFMANATYQLKPTQRLLGFWARQEYNKPQRDASALTAPIATSNEDDTFRIYQGTWSNILNDHAYLEARGSFVDISFPLLIQDEAKAAGNQSTTEQTTGQLTGAAATESIGKRRRLQLNAILSWYKAQWLGGRHEMKFGWDFANNPVSAETTALGDANVLLDGGQPLFAARFNTPIHPEETIRTNALFASDTIQRGPLTVNFGVRFDQARGIIPGQSSPAGTFAGARDFASLGTVVSWNTFSPRGGVIYQLTRDGRTVVKASAARYHHQISTTILSSANPNSLGFEFFFWQDLNQDLRFQPGEEGDFLGAAGGGLTSIDPNLKAPYTDEFLVTVEREIMPDFRLTGTLSFRNDRRQIGVRDVTSTWEPVPFTDPVTGSTFTVYNQVFDPVTGPLFSVVNAAQLDQDYTGFEVIATKRLSNRWQLLGSYAVGRAIQEQVSAEGNNIFGYGAIPVDPNNGVNARGPIFWDRTHMFKVSSSYLLPYDVLVSGNLLAQSGPVFTRTVFVEGLTQGSFPVFAEPRDVSDRLDSLTMVDLRGSKVFRLGNNRSIEALVDVYNLFNANTVLNANAVTGPAFGVPLTVLSPRIIRFGGRFLF